MTIIAAPYPQIAPLPTRPGPEAMIFLSLFLLRWISGILENFGAARMSETSAGFMLGVLAILFLLRMRLAQNSALFVAGICGWFATGALSYVANPTADAGATISLLTLLLLYALFTNAAMTYLNSTAMLGWLYRLLGAFVGLGFALSIFQITSGTGFVEFGREATQRAIGSDVHPVSFAIQIVAALVTLEITRAKLGRPAGPVHFALIAMGCVALYLTLARTAWVMGLLCVGFVFVAQGTFSRRFVTTLLALTAGVTLVAGSDRFADLASLPTFLANFFAGDLVFDWRYVDNSVSWRIVNWTLGLNQAMEQPVLGFGPGQSATSSYFNLEMHNIFLETLFEGGVLGLAAFLVTLAGLIRLHRRLPRATPQDKYARSLANSFSVSLLLAVTFSTSFVDQLMSFLIYILLISAANIPYHQTALPHTGTKITPGMHKIIV